MSTIPDSPASALGAVEGRELVMTRVFDAPRELVFRAWTDPQQVVHWWGPRGFTTTVQQMDVRPGGVWLHVLHGPDGTDYKNKVIYREVAEPERLAYSHVSGPLFDVVVTFEERGSQTELTMRMIFASPEELQRVAERFGAREGLAQTLARLGEHLPELAGGGSPADPQGDHEYLLTRRYAAPREVVFAAWLDPAALERWYLPPGFTLTTHSLDAREGGVWRFDMALPDGRLCQNQATYVELDSPARLVYEHSDVDGESHRFRGTVMLDEAGEDTRLTLRLSFPTAELREQACAAGALECARQTLQQLGDHLAASGYPQRERMVLILPSPLEFTLAREFDAPRDLVFEAWTRPEHVRRWWGCRTEELAVCEIDLRPGGAWRYVLTGPHGEHPFKGEYRAIERPARLVHTLVYDVAPYNEHEGVVTVEFLEREGRTLVLETTRHQTQEARDGHIGSGMDEGAAESLDRLAELVTEHVEAAR